MGQSRMYRGTLFIWFLAMVMQIIFSQAVFGENGSGQSFEPLQDSRITHLHVNVYADPVLTVRVEFIYQSMRYTFDDLRLVPSVLENSQQSSTTFRTATGQPGDLPTWASVTLLPSDKITGMFMMDYGANMIRIDTSQLGENSRTLQETNAEKLILMPHVCGSITSAELELQSENETERWDERRMLEQQLNGNQKQETRPPPDPLQKGINHLYQLPQRRHKESNRGESLEQNIVGRDLQVLKWADGTSSCYGKDGIRRKLHIGIVVDFAMEQRLTQIGFASVEKYVEALMSSVNAVYLAQLNIEIAVKQIFKFSDARTPLELSLVSTKRVNSMCKTEYDPLTAEPRETCCCDDRLKLAQRLDSLKSWIGTLTNWPTENQRFVRQAHWHLLTDCHPGPGNGGLSFIGTLCHASHFAGVSSYGPASDSSRDHWRMLAHELGHAFNASHSFENGIGTTGGIMDYGNGRYQGEYQFHPLRRQEVCSEVAVQVDSCKYLEPATSICGDGIVEVQKGEECECSSPGVTECQDCSQCKLVRPAQCRRGSMCCDSQGLFLPSSATCTVENGRKGVCIRGTCQVNICPLKSTVCEAEECRVRCAPLSDPTACSLSFMNQPDSLPCNKGAGVCSDGVCIAASSSRPPDTGASCVDYPSPWWDSDSTQFTCQWYAARPAMCVQYGFRLRNFGYTAVEACCACGGGLRPTSSPSKLPSVSPTVLEVTSSPTLCPDIVAVNMCKGRKTQANCLKGKKGCSWCKKTVTPEAERKAKNKKKKKKKTKKRAASQTICVPGPCTLARQCELI